MESSVKNERGEHDYEFENKLRESSVRFNEGSVVDADPSSGADFADIAIETTYKDSCCVINELDNYYNYYWS